MESGALSCPTLCDSMDCNLPGSSVHGIFQQEILECVAISFSRDLPNPGIEPVSLVSLALAGRCITTWPPCFCNLCLEAAKDVDANEKEIYHVIVLKVFIKLKFILMKHLEQNEKVF